jgi:hypothetical protein
VRSLSAPIRAQKAIFSAFESAPWIPSAAGLRRNENRSIANHSAQGEKDAKKGAIRVLSLCIIFASLLNACLALNVEQVNARKRV